MLFWGRGNRKAGRVDAATVKTSHRRRGCLASSTAAPTRSRGSTGRSRAAPTRSKPQVAECSVPADAVCVLCGSGGSGMVHACPCNGPESFVHVTCLNHQAESCFQNRRVWGENVTQMWGRCHKCNEVYGGFLGVALSWSCWRPACALDLDVKYISLAVLGNRLVTACAPLDLRQGVQEGIHILRQCVTLAERHSMRVPEVASFRLSVSLAASLMRDPSSTRDDLLEAKTILVNIILPGARRLEMKSEATFAAMLKRCRERLATRHHAPFLPKRPKDLFVSPEFLKNAEDA